MTISSTGASAADTYTAAFPAAASAIGGAPASAGAHSTAPATATQGATQPESNAAQGDPAAVDAAIKAANDAAKRAGTNVEFAKDNDSGRVVVRIIDSETQKVLRQFPSEEMLELGKALDGMRGTMIQLKA
ncbi:MAG TPA: flagellar protein FlaG [Burkholderiales bacterium]|jgi:flagellar protein FlaG